MGMFPGKWSCQLYQGSDKKPSAPNPREFEIERIQRVGSNVVVWVNYPNCTNYEGNKVLLFVDIPMSYIVSAEELDPHFSEVNELSPFARFEPTTNGFDAALILAEYVLK